MPMPRRWLSLRDEPGSSERLGHDGYVVLGSARNLKVTRPGDMGVARFYLQQGAFLPIPMLESFPENLRRVIFFARYEAVRTVLRVSNHSPAAGLARQMPELPLVLAISEIACARNRSGVPGQRRTLPSPPSGGFHFVPRRENGDATRCRCRPDQTGGQTLDRTFALRLISCRCAPRSNSKRGAYAGQTYRAAGLSFWKTLSAGPAWPEKPSGASRTAANPRQDSLRNRRRSSPPACRPQEMIGGIEVPFERGPVGHSDGTVLVPCDLGRPAWRGCAG